MLSDKIHTFFPSSILFDGGHGSFYFIACKRNITPLDRRHIYKNDYITFPTKKKRESSDFSLSHLKDMIR